MIFSRLMMSRFKVNAEAVADIQRFIKQSNNKTKTVRQLGKILCQKPNMEAWTKAR